MIENAHIILLAKYTFLFIEPQMWSKNIQNIAVESAIFADCPYLLHLSLVGSDLLTCRWTSRCFSKTSSNPPNAAKIPKIWRLLEVQDHMSVGTLQFFSKWWHSSALSVRLLHGTRLRLAARLTQQLLRALVFADVRGVVAEEKPRSAADPTVSSRGRSRLTPMRHGMTGRTGAWKNNIYIYYKYLYIYINIYYRYHM